MSAGLGLLCPPTIRVVLRRAVTLSGWRPASSESLESLGVRAPWLYLRVTIITTRNAEATMAPRQWKRRWIVQACSELGAERDLTLLQTGRNALSFCPKYREGQSCWQQTAAATSPADWHCRRRHRVLLKFPASERASNMGFRSPFQVTVHVVSPVIASCARPAFRSDKTSNAIPACTSSIPSLSSADNACVSMTWLWASTASSSPGMHSSSTWRQAAQGRKLCAEQKQ